VKEEEEFDLEKGDHILVRTQEVVARRDGPEFGVGG